MKNIIYILFLPILFASCTKQEFPIDTFGPNKRCVELTAPGQPPPSYSRLETANTTTSSIVTVYDEYDYATYLFFNRDINATVNYVRQLEHWEKWVDSLGGINLRFIPYIWTTPSPYSGDISTQLTQFGTRMDSLGKLKKAPNADIFSLREHSHYDGGIGYVGTLCFGALKYRCNATYIGCNLSGMPKWNWDAGASAHEDGHVMGSVHTQDCAWYDYKNNWSGVKLDNCYQEDNCAYPDPSPIYPPNNRIKFGHLMGYCDLTSAGIRLDSGFTDQPGAVVRNSIMSHDYCLVYHNDSIKTDTCTVYSQTQNIPCPTGQIGSITQTRTHQCPDSWTGWTTTNSNCKDTSTAVLDTAIRYCATCTSPHIVRDSIIVNGSYWKVGFANVTNAYFDWFDLTAKEELTLVKKSDGSLVGLTTFLTSCGDFPKTGGQRYSNGWTGQQVAISKLIKGHTYRCVVRSMNPENVSGYCYVPKACWKTY